MNFVRSRFSFSWVLILFVFAHFGHHLVTALPIPLLPMIRNDLALDYTQSGFLISAFTLLYGISQAPSGWLADRISPRILLANGICGVALCGLFVGLSNSYIMLVVFMALMGILGGGYHPAAPAMISAAVQRKNLGRAMGLHMVGGSAPFFLAPLIAVALAGAWGWRGSFIALAIPAAIFGIVFYVLLGRLPETGKAGHKRDNAHSRTPSPQNHFHRLVPVMILSVFTHAVTFSTIAFTSLFLVDEFGMSEAAGGAFLSIFYSAGLWASVMGGYLSDRWGGVPVILASSFISGPMIYLMNVVPFGVGIGFLLFILGIGSYVRTPVSEAYILKQIPEGRRSTILGLYYFFNIEGGGILTPVMGFLVDRSGFRAGFGMAGASVVVMSLVCLIWLRGSKD